MVSYFCLLVVAEHHDTLTPAFNIKSVVNAEYQSVIISMHGSLHWLLWPATTCTTHYHFHSAFLSQILTIQCSQHALSCKPDTAMAMQKSPGQDSSDMQLGVMVCMCEQYHDALGDPTGH
jgi:hypothetical protein